MPALQRPRFTVAYADGSTVDVAPAHPDMVAWDQTRGRHGWPAVSDAPFLWTAFVCWHALRRAGQTPTGETFDAWNERVDQIAADEPETVDPTNAGRAGDSPSN